jgi:hypothetical protein
MAMQVENNRITIENLEKELIRSSSSSNIIVKPSTQLKLYQNIRLKTLKTFT